MESLREKLQEKGYSLTDCQSFYHWMCTAGENKDYLVTQNEAGQMENNLFKFENKNPNYYHLFLTKCVSCEGTHSPKHCLNGELKRMKRAKKPPTPRDVFAAAEMLQTYIYITRFDKSVDRNIAELQGYIFAPTSKQNLDIAMLCLILHKRRDGSVEFARIDRQENMEHLMPCPGKIVNIDHKHCFGLRFLNDFSVLFEQTVAYGQKYDVNDFFRRMSLEFYGTENHHDRVMNIICDFELKEGNLDVFSKYTGEKITNETSVREKKKILGRHVEQVRKRLKPVGEGEFYALSSVYNVDVIIDDHRKGGWEWYMPVVCCFFSCFVSPIILRTQKGDRGCVFKPYVTESENTCSCRQQKPKIYGCIGKVKADVIEKVCKYH